MRAVVVDRWLEPQELQVKEIPEPEVAPQTLQIEVRAAGCNFFDILMVQGRYQVKPPFPFVPGAEIAGIVRAVGDGVEGFAVGDRVLGTAGLGGFAEVAVAPARGAWRSHTSRRRRRWRSRERRAPCRSAPPQAPHRRLRRARAGSRQP